MPLFILQRKGDWYEATLDERRTELIFATDCYFHIGQAHLNGGKPCQDYALSGDINEAAYAIVSDGCSGGGLTDVGARILALSTADAIRQHWMTTRNVLVDTVPQEINVRQRIVVAGTQQTLSLGLVDMLATCLFAYITPEGGILHLQGDGVVAYKKRSGHVTMHRYDWKRNQPFYPAYVEDNYVSFIQAHGNDVNSKAMISQCWGYTPDEGFELISRGYIALGEGIRGITLPITREELEEIDAIAVFSDGVTQIEGLDWKDAVVQLLAFKTTQGEFAKRRMIRVIKDAQKDSRGPLDDIAYAVVRVISSDEMDEA